MFYGYFYRNKGHDHIGRKLSGLGSVLCSLVNAGIFLYFGIKAWKG